MASLDLIVLLHYCRNSTGKAFDDSAAILKLLEKLYSNYC